MSLAFCRRLGKLRDVLFALPNRHEVGALKMHTGPDRRHLQLYCNEPQLFDRTGGADRAVTDKGRRLLVPFRIGVIEGVLQHRRMAAILTFAMAGLPWLWFDTKAT